MSDFIDLAVAQRIVEEAWARHRELPSDHPVHSMRAEIVRGLRGLRVSAQAAVPVSGPIGPRARLRAGRLCASRRAKASDQFLMPATYWSGVDCDSCDARAGEPCR